MTRSESRSKIMPPPFHLLILDRIRELNTSRAIIEKKAGLRPGAITDILRSKTGQIKAENVVRLAAALEVRVDELMLYLNLHTLDLYFENQIQHGSFITAHNAPVLTNILLRMIKHQHWEGVQNVLNTFQSLVNRAKATEL